jgi:hypothetical protein
VRWLISSVLPISFDVRPSSRRAATSRSRAVSSAFTGRLRAQVLEGPDARLVRLLAIQRAAGHVAPEDFAAGALHDAVVGVAALGVQDGRHARAQALVFVGARIEHHEGLAGEQLARPAEHVAQLDVAVHNGAVARDAESHGCELEGQPVIDVHPGYPLGSTT